MRFPPHILDEIRARLPVSQVVSRHVRLKKAGREYIGLSPFKQEKTPSFTVNDDKGFYHCFATGEHGDIFTFLLKTEGISFPEAVEKLAQEVGVELPKPDLVHQQREDQHQRLRGVIEASCGFFENTLLTHEGREARDYLARRGLSEEAIRSFRIGYAPPGRDRLKQHLLQLGYNINEIVQSGMCIGGRDIAVPYDRFRDRVMFPIEDLKGAVIAFGGRALSRDQKAKYLNSPETPLFHKGRLLFNAAKARQSAYDRNQLIAVEGYMDVIACAAAGFSNAVAPLGTALTDEQLKLMWRLVKEPVLCFDGDEAGRKAAWRAIDVALPLLAPGYSMAFAFLPEGQDPDDLVRSEGADAFRRVLEAAKPLVEVLWQRELEAAPTDTPERRADFEARLFAEVAKIENGFVKTHYEKDMRNRLWEQWRGGNKPRSYSAQAGAGRLGAFDRRPGFAAADRFQSDRLLARDRLRQSTLSARSGGGVSPREMLMLRAVLTHPWLLDDFAEELAELKFGNAEYARLRDAVLQAQIAVTSENGLDSEELRVHLKEKGFADILEKLDAAPYVADKWVRKADVARDVVEENWRHVLSIYNREIELQSELNGAERAFYEEGSEENFVRVKDLNAHYQNSEFTRTGSGKADDSEPLEDFAARILQRNGLLSPKG